MKKISLMLIAIVSISTICAQDTYPLEHLREEFIKYKVYEPGRAYIYEATIIDAEGDTLSTEEVTMDIKTGLVDPDDPEENRIYYTWEFPAREQYEKTLGEISKAATTRDWMDVDTTTMTLGEKHVYLHPLRENQYYQVEVAAHPNVEFDVKAGETYESKIVIMGGFGQYNQQMYISTHELMGEETFQLKDQEVNCYKIVAETKVEKFSIGAASKPPADEKSESKVETKMHKTTFLVSGEYGFVSMVYEFSNRETLSILMKEMRE